MDIPLVPLVDKLVNGIVWAIGNVNVVSSWPVTWPEASTPTLAERAVKLSPLVNVCAGVVSFWVWVSCVTDIVVFPAWFAVNVPVPLKTPVPWTVKVPFPTVGIVGKAI